MAVVGRSKEIEAVPMTGGAVGALMRILISEPDGAPYFAMRLFTVAPGGESPYHRHWGGHQVYVVGGKGELKVDGRLIPFAKGDFIFVTDDERHQFRNAGDDDLEFICVVPLERMKEDERA